MRTFLKILPLLLVGCSSKALPPTLPESDLERSARLEDEAGKRVDEWLLSVQKADYKGLDASRLSGVKSWKILQSTFTEDGGTIIMILMLDHFDNLAGKQFNERYILHFRIENNRVTAEPCLHTSWRSPSN